MGKVPPSRTTLLLSYVPFRKMRVLIYPSEEAFWGTRTKTPQRLYTKVQQKHSTFSKCCLLFGTYFSMVHQVLEKQAKFSIMDTFLSKGEKGSKCACMRTCFKEYIYLVLLLSHHQQSVCRRYSGTWRRLKELVRIYGNDCGFLGQRREI